MTRHPNSNRLLVCNQKDEHPFLRDVKRHLNLFASVPAADWTADINDDNHSQITARVYGRISLAVNLIPNREKPGTHLVQNLAITDANPYDYETGRIDISQLNLVIETWPFDPQDLVSLIASLIVIGNDELDAISFPSMPQGKLNAINRVGEQMLLKAYAEFPEASKEDETRSFMIWLSADHEWISSSQKLMTNPIRRILPNSPNPLPTIMGIYRPRIRDPKNTIIATLASPSFELSMRNYDVIAAMNAIRAITALTDTYACGPRS